MASNPIKDQVVELRIHGIGGTPPRSMLDDPNPAQVAGDDVGRVFRRTNPVVAVLHGDQERVVEAFHWGQFTAGSATRALWLLLLPFALLNLARYALLMPAGERRLQDRLADLVLRLLGLVLTLTMVSTAAYVALDVGARQCGDLVRCAGRNSWLVWYVDRSFGVRVLVAAVLPALVIALVWWFGRQSFSYDPPGPKKNWQQGNGSFRDPMFWRGAAVAPVQRAAHVTMACALLGALVLGTLGPPRTWLDNHAGTDENVYIGLFALCIAVAGYALVLVFWNRRPPLAEAVPDRLGRDAVALPWWVWGIRTVVAAPTAAVCVGWSVWQLGNSKPDPAQALTGLEIAANVLAALTAVLLAALLVLAAGIAWSGAGRKMRGHGAWVPPAFRPYWGGLGGWMLAALAATLGWGLSTAVVFWTAKTLGTPVLEDTGADDGDEIGIAASYWTGAVLWGVLAATAVVFLLSVAAWLLHRRAVPVTALVLSAIGIAIAAVWSYNGADLVSDQGEWFVLAGALFGGAVAALLVTGRKDDLRRWRVGRWLVRGRIPLVAGLGVAAVLAVLAAWARRDGADLFSDQAEWLVFAGVTAAFALAIFVVAGRGDDLLDRVGLDYATSGEAPELARAKPKVARMWRIALARYRYYHAFGAIAAFGGVMVMAAGGMAGWRTVIASERQEPPAVLRAAADSWFGPIGVTVVAAIAAGLVALGITTWRTPALRHTTGILWDLLSFWPRSAHPLCPPPYGGRAVLGVAARATQLVTDLDAKHVVLSGHSQGSVIGVAACAVLHDQANPKDTNPGAPPDPEAGSATETLEQLSLVTYGSQLQFIYARLFPAYLGFATLRMIYSEVLLRRWHNVHRWTDPLGGPVLAWPHENDPSAYGPDVVTWRCMACPESGLGHAAKPVSLRAPGVTHRYWSTGAERRLRDPDVIIENAYQARSPMRGHSGYPDDPSFDAMVAWIAETTWVAPDCAPPAVHAGVVANEAEVTVAGVDGGGDDTTPGETADVPVPA